MLSTNCRIRDASQVRVCVCGTALLLTFLPLASCNAHHAANAEVSSGDKRTNGPQVVQGTRRDARISPNDASLFTFDIVNSWPHDANAFTQGLEFYDGVLYESTGRYGQSSLRRVELNTGQILRKVDVPPEYFAEGMTIFGGKVYQLTWKSQKGFIYSLKNFEKVGEFSYEGEGWGLTHDGSSLIMSDGTNRIRFLDPDTLRVKRSITVNNGSSPLAELNELEYIKGEIYANVWQTDRIVRIDPNSGRILGWIDLSGLLPASNQKADVLNGIAYDPGTDRLFVTGKLWPQIFEIRLRKKGTSP